MRRTEGGSRRRTRGRRMPVMFRLGCVTTGVSNVEEEAERNQGNERFSGR
jgi:hypothetical protein